MFLDEISPLEIGFTEQEWKALSLFERRIAVAFFARRTPIATARALGVQDSSFSDIRRKIVKLRLVERFARVKQVCAPQRACLTR